MRLHLQDRGDHCRQCRSQGEGPEEASQLVFSYLRDLLTLQTDSDGDDGSILDIRGRGDSYVRIP